MVIVRISGGLGNQLFQYAAGRTLSKMHGTTLKVDTSGLATDPLRNLELQAFTTNVTFASKEETSKLKAESSFERVFQKLLPYSKKKFYKQPYFHFDKDFFRLSGEIYLQGYFQSEKYFAPYQLELRNEFQLKNIRSDLKTLANELRSSNSVSLHIRRGDYNDPALQKVHGLLAMEYYQAAIKTMDPGCKFYLFSDDPAVASKELGTKNVCVVSGILTKSPLEDFWLMSQCRHNIIANSSFSWWAAWLNSNPNKIVIGPEKWFANGPKDTYDILPANWIKI